MEKREVERIAEKVIAKLIGCSRRLLLVYSGSSLGVAEIHPQLKLLYGEGYRFTVYASAAARKILDLPQICRELGAEIYEDGDDTMRFLDRGTAILIPALTQTSAAKLAMGINDTPFTNIVTHGLFRGYEIVASTEGTCPGSRSRRQLGLDHMTPAYRRMMGERLQTLQSYGIRLAAAPDFYGTVRDATKLRMATGLAAPLAAPGLPLSSGLQARPRGAPPPPNSRVITLADVIAVKRGESIELPVKALLTPSAKDHIKDFQIRIVRRD